MSTVVIRERICDQHERIGEVVPAERRRFPVNGKTKTPDLCEECYQATVSAILELIDTKQAAPDPREVRRWARENGVPVSTRGVVSQEVVDQYLAAH